MALDLSRRLDRAGLDVPALRRALAAMGRAAFADRAAGLARRVGGTDIAASDASLVAVAARVARPDPADSPVRFADFRAACERPRAAAVFTAHPTFSLPRATNAALAAAACGAPIPDDLPLRPSPPDLGEEFDQATAAMMHGRDALDRLAAAFLGVARGIWPDRWAALRPQPVILSSWVGYDTDGRTDIGWQDSLRLRLRMKELGLARLAAGMDALPDDVATPIRARLAGALEAVRAAIAACPGPGTPDAAATQAFARALIGGREAAMTTPAPLLALFDAAVAAAADDRARLVLAVARAGLAAHGLSLAHTHVRLNATQLHNAVRLRVPALGDDLDDPTRRRALFGAIGEALDEARPEPVDFGGLLAESAERDAPHDDRRPDREARGFLAARALPRRGD
jgi:phosphoenolpyruvate carboxylase